MKASEGIADFKHRFPNQPQYFQAEEEVAEQVPELKYYEGQRAWKLVKCDIIMPSATQNEIEESCA